jgi:hypothetical protein
VIRGSNIITIVYRYNYYYYRHHCRYYHVRVCLRGQWILIGRPRGSTEIIIITVFVLSCFEFWLAARTRTNITMHTASDAPTTFLLSFFPRRKLLYTRARSLHIRIPRPRFLLFINKNSGAPVAFFPLCSDEGQKTVPAYRYDDDDAAVVAPTNVLCLIERVQC